MAWATHLFGFTGRFRRRDFWYVYILLNFYRLATFLIAAAIDSDPSSSANQIATFVLMVPATFSIIAAIVKRLHDLDIGGRWLAAYGVLVALTITAWAIIEHALKFTGGVAFAIEAPLLAPTILVGVWWGFKIQFFRGTEGDNRFGPNPLA